MTSSPIDFDSLHMHISKIIYDCGCFDFVDFIAEAIFEQIKPVP